MRVVLDTNVAVAGLLWRGAPYTLLGYALARTMQCFATELLIAELQRVLGYPHLAQRLAALNTTGAELVAEYRAMVEIVEPANITPTVTADPDDDRVLACALAAEAEIIVSGDADLLNLKRFQGIDIVGIVEAIRRIEQSAQSSK